MNFTTAALGVTLVHLPANAAAPHLPRDFIAVDLALSEDPQEWKDVEFSFRVTTEVLMGQSKRFCLTALMPACQPTSFPDTHCSLTTDK